MLSDILLTIWLFLPAGLANMAPIFAAHWRLWPALDKPIDGGRQWRGKRLFGDHKTLRGFVVGWLTALIAVLIQAWLEAVSPALKEFIYIFDYEQVNLLAWASALSLGALGGDAIKSFFKRRAGVKPGKSWVPFDQIDYVAGTIAASLLVVQLPLRFYVIALIAGLALHPLSTFLGWLFKLKDSPI